MTLLGLALVIGGVAVLYAQVNDVSTGDLWHTLRDHGLQGLVDYTDQKRHKPAAAAP